MTFEESLAWLYSTQQFGIKLGLENIHRLLAALGSPESKFQSIHVAGTNGKGSVCVMMDSILRRTGRRCGLTTSPHLVHFCERIRVDGEMIPRSAVAKGLTRIRELSAGWEHSPTFFEINIALAFDWFALTGCEIAVVETGMGGRLDATNVLRPLVSVITPIALDHTQWLGSTLAAIAGEKAGIIKEGIPVVSAPQEPEAGEVLQKTAESRSAPIRFVTDPIQGILPGIPGHHQLWNAALAVKALEVAGLAPSQDLIRVGIEQAFWPGRFQIVRERFILDGAHNIHAARALCEIWRERFGHTEPIIIFGVLQDKDFGSILDLLATLSTRFLYVPVHSDRSLAPQELADLHPGQVCHSLQEALDAVSSSKDPVLITGSLFLVGEALKLLDSAPR